MEQAIYARRGDALAGLVHHGDRGAQYLAMRYTDRLAEAGIAPSVGSQGDAYDNALAESVIGLFKTEVIRRKGPWRSLEAVEFATLAWVDLCWDQNVIWARNPNKATAFLSGFKAGFTTICRLGVIFRFSVSWIL